jgi:uncharacterized protein (TIGR03067 family)
MRVATLIAVLAFLPPDRPNPTPPAEKDTRSLVEQMQGEWQIVSATLRGKPHSTLKPGQAAFRFDGGKMFLRFGKGVETLYSFNVEATKSPAHFEFAIGKGTAKPFPGIVKIEGDMLFICYAIGNTPRPAEFTSPDGSSTALWQMQRVKK